MAEIRIRLEPELLEELRRRADAEHRPTANLIRSMLWRAIAGADRPATGVVELSPELLEAVRAAVRVEIGQ